jgi:[protein-PII] uridylyltransferase
LNVLVGRGERVMGAQQAFVEALTLDWKKAKINNYLARHGDAYWLSFPTEVQAHHAELIEAMGDKPLQLDIVADSLRDCSEITVICQDHAGLFARLSGACALAGLSILDARITTTNDGLAIDTLHVKCHETGPGPLDAARAERVRQTIEDVLSGAVIVPQRMGDMAPSRQIEAFDLTPQINIDNELSDQATVIEVSGLDRPGLLYALVRQLFNLNVSVQAARVATFGERAVDVFYVTGLTGDKITQRDKKKKLRDGLLAVMDNPVAASQPKSQPKNQPKHKTPGQAA